MKPAPVMITEQACEDDSKIGTPGLGIFLEALAIGFIEQGAYQVTHSVAGESPRRCFPPGRQCRLPIPYGMVSRSIPILSLLRCCSQLINGLG